MAFSDIGYHALRCGGYSGYIVSIDGFSGHADYNEMLAWLMAFNKPLKKVFLVHGESAASEAFGKRIRAEFGWTPILPKFEQRFKIDF